MVASAQEGDTPKAGQALSRLCGIYWRPVYHFIRHHGHSQHDAEDLTQGFFEALIEKNYLKSVDQKRGKFRSFLMAATKHYVSDQRERQRAWKRGGRAVKISFDVADAEPTVTSELSASIDPESAFDRAWACTVLDRALLELRQLFEARGKGERFEALRPCLLGESGQPYSEIAQGLGVSEDVVKTEVKRMRQSFRSLLRDEVGETLKEPSELDSELRYLGSLVR
ncbi:sigma-70 family RNA polymerase sigma factor [Verrucomicrobia bacterium]|jgi:RNA polymerase sigma factor (sigma-70 family)|nr:sigma-70 family RNA polymerase sigma factor [Verrucomicrobiota bacterium]